MPENFALPQEIWDRILDHLDLGSLACAYECNKDIRRRVVSFFSKCYYKSKLNTPAAPCGDPYQILQGFLYLFDDEKVDTKAKDVLAKLHNSSDRGQPPWKEAVAIALKARDCNNASKYFYDFSLKHPTSDNNTKRNAFLTAARFNQEPLDSGAKLKPEDKCWAYSWMAYHGKTDDMKALAIVSEQFTKVEAYSPTTMAAISGRVATLEYLQAAGFDLWLDAYQNSDFPSSPLVAASEHGHEKVVKYLCGNGSKQRLTEDQIYRAYRAAAMKGHVRVLRQMEKLYSKETNDWCCNYASYCSRLYPNGIDWYIFGPGKPSKDSDRVEMLEHFIQKQWYDIHAVNQDGNSVLHLAAAEGSLGLFRISWNAGANSNVNQPNNSGQSPLELAGNDESCIANWLSEEQSVEMPVTRNEKIKAARTIIEAQRQLRIQHIVEHLFLYKYRKDMFSKDGLKKILEIVKEQWGKEKMDERLADICVRHYSITAMNGYIDRASKVLGVISPPEPETLASIFLKSLEDEGWFISKSEAKRVKVKSGNDAEKSGEIATFLFAFGILHSEPPLPQIFLGLRADLAEIKSYLQSKEGEMLKAGNEAARGHENEVRRSFQEKLRGLDELWDGEMPKRDFLHNSYVDRLAS